MGYNYSWEITVVAESISRSEEITRESAEEVFSDKNKVDMVPFSVKNHGNTITGEFSKWRENLDTALFIAISKRLQDEELAYGTWHGEGGDNGFYFITKDGVEDNPGTHPKRKEIEAAWKRQKETEHGRHELYMEWNG
jgi:hypothetical protein